MIVARHRCRDVLTGERLEDDGVYDRPRRGGQRDQRARTKDESSTIPGVGRGSRKPPLELWSGCRDGLILYGRWRRRLMPRLLALLLLAVALASCGTFDSREVSPGAILDRFLGRWNTEALIRNDGPPVRELRTFGRAVCRRTLEGRYVEFRTSSIDPPGQAELQIMTYDPDAGVYRQWVFDSDGYRHEAVGRWDPATSTLRWEGQVDGATFVIDDHWVSRDRLEWTLTRTAADGHLLQTIQGVVARVGS